MTEEQLKESSKYWRVSIHFLWWVFQVFGDWKRHVIYMGHIGFKVYDWHPFKPKKDIEQTDEYKTWKSKRRSK